MSEEAMYSMRVYGLHPVEILRWALDRMNPATRQATFDVCVGGEEDKVEITAYQPTFLRIQHNSDNTFIQTRSVEAFTRVAYSFLKVPKPVITGLVAMCTPFSVYLGWFQNDHRPNAIWVSYQRHVSETNPIQPKR